jgi:hypothetical protein
MQIVHDNVKKGRILLQRIYAANVSMGNLLEKTAACVPKDWGRIVRKITLQAVLDLVNSSWLSSRLAYGFGGAALDKCALWNVDPFHNLSLRGKLCR